MPRKNKILEIFLLLIFFILIVFGKVDKSLFDAVLIGFSFVLMTIYGFLLGGIVLVLGFLIKTFSYIEEINIVSEIAKYLVYISIFYYAMTIFEKYKSKIRDNYLIAEKISLGVAVIDEKMNYIYVNKAYAELKGSFKSELEGKNIKKYWYKEKEQKEVYDWIEDNIKNNLEWMGEILSKGKEGKEYWEENFIFPIEVEKNRYEYVILAKNITHRIEMEKKVIELKRKVVDASYEKSIFLANMSHDIRTPVNGIIGFIDMLLEMEKDKEKIEMLHIVKSSSELLVMLINDILDLSKIEAGKLKLNYEKVELEKLMRIVSMKFDKMIEVKGVNFVFDYDKSICENIMIDRVRIEQVLMNLLGNAMKFTEKGEITMKIAKVSENEKTVKIRFEVKDSGVGIEEEKLKVIFEEFTQANEKITEKYGGTGLGLAIAKKIVDKMGGKLNVNSEVNKGSKFYFDLELKKNVEYEFELFDENGSKRELKTLILSEEKIEIFSKNLNADVRYIYDFIKLEEEIKKGGNDIIVVDLRNEYEEKLKLITSLKNYKYGTLFFAYKDEISGKEIKELENAGIDDYLTEKMSIEEIYMVINKKLNSNRS